jgi:hypothetical protein
MPCHISWSQQDIVAEAIKEWLRKHVTSKQAIFVCVPGSEEGSQESFQSALLRVMAGALFSKGN